MKNKNPKKFIKINQKMSKIQKYQKISKNCSYLFQEKDFFYIMYCWRAKLD